MQKFLYEMHCHTSQTSKCGKISADDLIKYYHRMGYSGVCITDHFLNSNTTVPCELDWQTRVEMFFDGYNLAKSEGDQLGIDIFFGWEYSYKGTDFLTYGLDKSWLLKNEQCTRMSISEYCDFVRSEGGFVFQAHPYREARYIEMIRLLPRNVDGVETFNACRTDFENDMAEAYAKNYRLCEMAGSDNHVGILPRLAAMEFDKKQSSIIEICQNIKCGAGEIRIIEE